MLHRVVMHRSESMKSFVVLEICMPKSILMLSMFYVCASAKPSKRMKCHIQTQMLAKKNIERPELR